MSSKWSKDKHNFLIELKSSKKYTWKEIAEIMTSKYEHVYTGEQCRSRWRTNRHKVEEIDPVKKYGKRVRTHRDGSKTIEQLIEVYAETELNTPKDILLANNLDPKEWELKDHELSVWGHHNKVDGTITLYASKIRVIPREHKLTIDDLIEKMKEPVEPLKIISKQKLSNDRSLGIYFTDLHFGINTIKDYQDVLKQTIDLLESNHWEEVIIPFGSDMLHVDNLNNTTANQTRIQDVDIPSMIENAKQFYVTIINKAIEQSNKVTVLYIAGNHDLSTSYLLSHWLDGYYKDVDKVTVCKKLDEIKVYMYGKVFMAFTHGDKGGKRKVDTLASQYPMEWARASVREMYTGHLHREQVLDENGLTFRVLPTAAKTDDWHKRNSYVGAHKRFAIFEYTTDRVKSIHYV